MLKILIKNSFKSFFEPFKAEKNKKGKKKIGKTILLVFVFAILFFSYVVMFYETFAEVAAVYDYLRLGWLYYGISSVSSALLTLSFTVLSSEQYLYEAKDNDLLLSMPIKKEYLLISRFIPLFILGFISSAVSMIPTIIAWCINVKVDILMITLFVIIFPFFTVIPVMVGSFFGWLINLISKKLGSKTAVKVICSLILIFGLELSMTFMENSAAMIIYNSTALERMFKYIFPVYLLGKAIGNKSIISLILFILFTVVITYLIFKVLSKTYISTITNGYNFKLKKYKEKRTKPVSIDFALLKREIRQLTGSFIYLMNSYFSMLMMLVTIILLIIFSKEINIIFEQLSLAYYNNSVGIIAAAIICLILSTTLISACSVSLEGKNMWISHTLPADTVSILLAKVFNQVIFTLPITLITCIVVAILIKPTLLVLMNLILIPLGYCILIALMGVIINVQFPKLDWQNEAQVVKQSGSVLIAMMVNMLYIVIPSVVYYFALREKIRLDKYATIFMIITYLIVFLAYRVLVTETKNKYERLG